MSETKINFTKEHQTRLNELAGEALVKGTTFRGSSTGNEMTIYDLFHNCSINTLARMFGNLKKEVAAIDDLDEWSLTPYQKGKQSRLNSQKELISLIIGFKRFSEQQKADRENYKALKAQYDQLVEEKKTPEERLAEMKAKLDAFGQMEPEVIAD